MLLPRAEAAGLGDVVDAEGEAGELEVVAYRPRAITLRVRSERTAVLVSSEVAYPGWEVRVDAKPAQLLNVNTAFRGVKVPAGLHSVEFVFVPRSFRLGLAISAVTLAAAALAFRRGRG